MPEDIAAARQKIETVLPLSPTQQGLLFHTLLAPDSGVYYEQVSCTFYAAIDVASYRRAWEAVVARHGVLRTCFLWEGPSKPVQAVLRQVDLPWIEEDWRGISRAQQTRRFAEFLEIERRPGFELGRAPLLRCGLFRTGERRWEFVWSYHHLLLDGWSVPVLLREIFSLYQAFRRGTELTLPPVRPYADFIGWLQGQDLDAAQSFWRERLRGVSKATPLAFLRGDADSDAAGHGVCEHLLDAGVSARLQRLAQECRVTLNTLIQAGWSLLLARSTGRDDIVFGVTVSGRPAELAGVESMVGLFINALPVRVGLREDLTLAAWFRALHESHVEAEAYSYTPLNEIQTWSEIAPGDPLFESLIIFENYPVHGMLDQHRAELGIEDIEIFQLTNYPLTLVVLPGARLCLRVHFEKRRINEPAARRVLQHLTRILCRFLDGADQRVGDISLLTSDEHEEIVARWSGRAIKLPDEASGMCLHRQFEAQVRARPASIAAACEGVEITYEALNRRANALARRLGEAGLVRESPVALCLERGIDLIAAMLAVLKAGGFYVPLDPRYPAERINWTVNDIGAAIAVCDAAGAALLENYRGQVIMAGAADEPDQAEQNPDSPNRPHDLCYVIYTSGSTGEPKGVCVEHRNVAHLFAATREVYALGPDDVWTMFHSQAFDFSVWEIWGALLHGGRLEIVPFGISRSPRDFLALLWERGVTRLSQTPSAFRQLLEAVEASGRSLPGQLRHVFFGGEALDPRRIRSAFAETGTGPALINMFGITETTVHVTERALRPDDAGRALSPIGRPLPGYRIYLLDARGQPVPPGVAGEIHVGGAGVARGYHNRPELTALRFVPDPFERDGRLYRSGDLGRWNDRGELDYLGRIDDQVKVHGFRIELGEVEAALMTHPQVADAAAALARAGDGHPQLAGFYVAHEPVPGPAAIREWLAGRLPAHAVPALLAPIDCIPLTTNGKTDRKALARQAAHPVAPVTAYVAPTSAIETELARIFALALGQPRVGIADDYFELGGDSIRSIQILAAARKAGLDFSLETLLQARTIARLAPHVRARVSDHPAPKAPPAAATLPAGIEDIYPPSALQSGMLAYGMQQADGLLYHVVNDVKLRLAFDETCLREALAAVFARHPVLRTDFDLAADPEPVQRVHAEVEPLLEVEDLRALDSDERERRIAAWREAERSTAFDVTRAPLIRFSVHRLSDDVMHLGTAEHHAILDGWSYSNLIGELLGEYRARLHGRALSVSVPARHFRDFIALEREAARSPEHRSWWDRRLATLPRMTPPIERDPDGGRVAVAISPLIIEQLERSARMAGAPIKSVLLALHLLALALATGQKRIATGVVFNGREEGDDGERVLGLFLNTLPLAVEIDPANFDPIALIRAVHAEELAIIPFRRYPLAELNKLHGQLFEAVFNFTHFHNLHVASSGLEAFDIRSDARTNLTLVLEASRDAASGRLSMELHPGPRRFSAATMTRLAAIWAEAAKALVTGRWPSLMPVWPSPSLSPFSAKSAPAEVPSHRAPGKNTAEAETERELLEIWSSVLGVEISDPRTDFYDVGGDSLLMVRICAIAAERLGLDHVAISAMMTARDAATQADIAAGARRPLGGGLVVLSRRLDAPPLFFAPGAGGHVIYLRDLADALDGSRTLWALQARGLDGRSPPEREVEAIAAAAIEDIRQVQPSGPYAIGGHSFGAWTAFEIARQLRLDGEEIEFLALVDSLAPGASATPGKQDWSDARWMAEIGNVFGVFTGKSLNLSEGAFAGLSPAGQVAALRRCLIDAGVVPPEIGVREVGAYVAVFKANSLTSYIPASPYRGPVRLLLASERSADAPSAAAMVESWRPFVDGAIITRDASGNHVTMMRRPHVFALADALGEALETADPA